MDYLTAFKTQYDELQDLRTRMENDRKLYYYSKNKYTMLNARNNNVPGAKNTTMPDPRLFADKVIASMKSARLTKEIEGDDLKDEGANDIEQFLTDYMALVDQHLVYLGYRGGLHGVDCGRATLRGWLYTKCFPYEHEGKFYPGVIPWDAAYSCYEYGRDSLNWMGTKMKRTKAQIEAEYPEVTNLKGKEAEVIDIITTEGEEIYIESKPVKPVKHKFGFTPGVVEANDISAALRDEGYMEHEGESIFPNVRDLYPVLNEYVTVLRSIHNRTFLTNYIAKLKDKKQGKIEGVYDEMGVIPMEVGEDMIPQLIQDIKQSSIYLLNLIEARLQRGGLPATDYGNLNFTLSAVAIKTLSEAHNSVLGPLLDTIARSRKQLYRMIIDCWNTGNYKHEDITAPDKSVLKSKFDIGIQLESISGIENIANYSLASEATRWMGDEQVLSEILHVENPQEAIRKRRCDRAEFLTSQSPPLQIWNSAEALLEDGQEMKAAMTAGLLGITLEQLKGGEFNPETPKMPAGGNGSNLPSLPDLFGPGRVNPGEQSSYQESANMSKQLGVNK